MPIPKGNNTCQPSNYRPISLLSVLSKLLERHPYKHILKHMESTMPLALQQWGFRSSRSTVSALLYVTHKWFQSMEKGKEICHLFLTYAKHLTQFPIDRYKACNINEYILRWLFSYLQGTEQSVVLDGKTSSAIPVLLGVPQGCFGSPSFSFILMPPCVQLNPSTYITMYADDLLLHREINCPEDYPKLHQDVNEIANWVDVNHLRNAKNDCL